MLSANDDETKCFTSVATLYSSLTQQKKMEHIQWAIITLRYSHIKQRCAGALCSETLDEVVKKYKQRAIVGDECTLPMFSTFHPHTQAPSVCLTVYH